MSKITIPTEVWIQLYAELANWHVEESALDNPYQEDEHGNESYTEEAQDKFNHASGCVEEILGRFFEKEEIYKSCSCSDGTGESNVDEEHYHCSECDCILTGHEIDICCWCEDKLMEEI